MYEPIRSARRYTIARLVAAHFALTLVVNLVFFAGNTFRPLASATGGLLTGSLLVNLVFIGVLIGLIPIGFGRLRLYDLGVIARNVPVGLAYTLGIWGAAQAIHLIAGLVTYGSVSLNRDWSNPGFMLGMALAQILGNALFEEIAYRGFLFPQLYLRLAGLRDAGIQTISLSLDGSTASLHDGLRGVSGTFEMTMDAFEIAADPRHGSRPCRSRSRRVGTRWCRRTPPCTGR